MRREKPERKLGNLRDAGLVINRVQAKTRSPQTDRPVTAAVRQRGARGSSELSFRSLLPARTLSFSTSLSPLGGLLPLVHSPAGISTRLSPVQELGSAEDTRTNTPAPCQPQVTFRQPQVPRLKRRERKFEQGRIAYILLSPMNRKTAVCHFYLYRFALEDEGTASCSREQLLHIAMFRRVLSRSFAELEVLEKRRNFTVYKVPNHTKKAPVMVTNEFQSKPEPIVCSFLPYKLVNPRISEKKYFWCSCGLSRSQPFCDSSHMQTPFKPVVFQVEEPVKEVYLCMCKHTSQAPYCDGKACVTLKRVTSS